MVVSYCNGSPPGATRVLSGGRASASTALATFAEPPSHRSDGPPYPVQYSSVTSLVAHEQSRVSSSCRTSNAGAGNGEKRSRARWGKGERSESVLSGNGGMAAAVLSPGGVFRNKNKKVVDSNHFHVSLAHAHSSVLTATVQQHDIQLVGELASARRHRTVPRPGQRHHSTWSTSIPRGRSLNYWEARDTSSCSWIAFPAFSARTGRGARAHRPSSVWYSGLWQTWEFLECSERITAPTTPTRRSWSTVTVSKSAAS